MKIRNNVQTFLLLTETKELVALSANGWSLIIGSEAVDSKPHYPNCVKTDWQLLPEGCIKTSASAGMHHSGRITMGRRGRRATQPSDPDLPRRSPPGES